MRLPEYTAHASLYRSGATYIGSPDRGSSSRVTSVAPQYIFVFPGGPLPGGGWWSYVWCRLQGQGCGLDSFGQCRCHSVEALGSWE